MNCDWGVYKNKTKSRNNFPVLNENMFPPTVNVLQEILLNFNLFSTLITGFWITSDLPIATWKTNSTKIIKGNFENLTELRFSRKILTIRSYEERT